MPLTFWLCIKGFRYTPFQYYYFDYFLVVTLYISIFNFLGANSVRIYGAENLYQALENRPDDTPLITIANHHSCMDEPLLWGNPFRVWKFTNFSATQIFREMIVGQLAVLRIAILTIYETLNFEF